MSKFERFLLYEELSFSTRNYHFPLGHMKTASCTAAAGAGWVHGIDTCTGTRYVTFIFNLSTPCGRYSMTERRGDSVP